MHETVIAKNLITEAEKQGKVTAVEIEVGELAHLTKEELEETMKTMVDWALDVKEIPATVQCVCGYKGRPKILERGHDVCMYVCPKCENVPGIEVGGDIVLKKVAIVGAPQSAS